MSNILDLNINKSKENIDSYNWIINIMNKLEFNYDKKNKNFKIKEIESEYNPEPEQVILYESKILNYINDNNIDSLMFYEEGDYYFSLYLLKKYEFLIQKFESNLKINLNKYTIINKYNLIIVLNKIGLFTYSSKYEKEVYDKYKIFSRIIESNSKIDKEKVEYQSKILKNIWKIKVNLNKCFNYSEKFK